MQKSFPRRITVSAIFFLLATGAFPQKFATLEVDLQKPAYGLDIPVSLNLDELTYLYDTLLVMHEVKGNTRVEVPFQVENGSQRKIHWLVTGAKLSGEKRLYELSQGKAAKSRCVITSVSDGALILKYQNRSLLQYYFRTVYPPPGVDSAYRRSGFIHPLWSPNGQVLTRIQPPDHYHHYGIWNPWTHVAYEGDTIDFWNINSKQGTVRFANFAAIEEGPVYGEFDALHEHIVFRKAGGTKIALNELQSVRVFRLQDDDNYFAVDFNIRLNCADKNPVRLLEYRYAGLGWRTTEKWDNKNSMVLTSEGMTRKDADGSKARWCIVQGQIDDDYAGVVMMSFPTNYNYPEPLRIWPENQYNRGDMFANFCPTKDMDWPLEPGKNYVLKYRFLVFNGKIDRDKAESAWYYFANPPKITVRTIK